MFIGLPLAPLITLSRSCDGSLSILILLFTLENGVLEFDVSSLGFSFGRDEVF